MLKNNRMTSIKKSLRDLLMLNLESNVLIINCLISIKCLRYHICRGYGKPDNILISKVLNKFLSDYFSFILLIFRYLNQNLTKYCKKRQFELIQTVVKILL